MNRARHDDWARQEAMPSADEISRVRRLVERIKTELDDLSADERAEIEQAVALVRRGRVLLRVTPTPPAVGARPSPRAGLVTTTASAMAQGQADNSARRRQKVIKAINQAARGSGDLAVAAIARQAGVDRSFLYRRRDLLEQLHRAQEAEPAGPAAGPLVSRESLKADLANAHERNRRLQARVQHLERRLSEAMGEQVWRGSGLGAATDIEALRRQILLLEQANIELTKVIEERDRDLAAARAANRELMVRMNSPTRPT